MKPFLLFLSLCFTFMLNAQVSKTVNVTAGGLSSKLTSTEKTSVTDLTITGIIDARDFKTLRDDMPVLAGLDLSKVIVAAYTGRGGTVWGDHEVAYLENTIPESAFEDCDVLTSILLPTTIVTIEAWAFDWATGLESINIPNSVTNIGEEAFDYCISLISVFIPSSVTTIGDVAFRRGSGLITVDENNPNYSSIDGVLFNKQKTTLLFCPVSKTGSYTVPYSVTSIEGDAFDDCLGLTTVVIPSSVTSIGNEAFYDCSGLTSIYIYSNNPVTLVYGDVFYNVNMTTCTLYVPAGSKNAYQEAVLWKDFKNIIELKLMLSSLMVTLSSEMGSTDSVKIISIATEWNAISDQSWLTVSPISGSDNGMLTFSATANTTSTVRTAHVTVSATGSTSQIITVTQASGITTLLVSTNTVTLTKEAGSNSTVNITSNTIWAASSNQTWLSVSPKSGTGNGTLTLTALANPNSSPRTAIITVSATGVTSQTITVTQAAGVATLLVSTNTVTLTKEAGSNAIVNVITNTTWTALSNQTWLTISPSSGTGNGTLNFTAEANPSNTTRTAIVTVSAEGVTSQTITITQEAGTGNGVSYLTNENVKLYPNPVTYDFHVEGIEGVTKLVLSDLNGKVRISKEIAEHENISVGSLPKGVYFVTITTIKGKIERKLVKE